MRLAAAAALALVLLGACGDDAAPGDTAASSATPSETTSGSSPSGEPEESESSAEPSETAPPNTRDCAEVWRAGGQIPRFYPGCMDGEEFVERVGRACSSGQRLLRHRNFYGVPGGTVHQGTKPLSDDPGFRRAAIECVA